MKLDIGYQLDVGQKRKGRANQDSLAVVLLKNRPSFLIIADGMGGYKGGEVASRIVVNNLKRFYKKKGKSLSIEEFLLQGIADAHGAIRRIAKRRKKIGQMGSTVVAAVVDEKSEMVWIANVGDSRALMVDAVKVELISHDHSFVADLQRQGLLTEQEAREHPKKNVLSMSLTLKRETVEPFSACYLFKENQVLVLCSDGLWGVVSESQIQLVVLSLPPQEAADKLVKMANTLGGPDNISVIVVRSIDFKYDDEDALSMEDTNS
ncbi:protein phosphatase 2C domain-containing protein [bacterium]|nr:protein phosphatase 2C domain-containing protein [bacterium]